MVSFSSYIFINMMESDLMSHLLYMSVLVNSDSITLRSPFFFFTGKLDNTGELTEKEIIRAERNSGVISNRVREIQVCVMILELQASTP